MGKIICPTHGDCIIALVCSHVRSSVLSGKPVVEYQKNGSATSGICHSLSGSVPSVLMLSMLRACRPQGLYVCLVTTTTCLERIFETVSSKSEPVCGKCFSNAIGAQVNQTPQV
jgi:hypothetical protein